jgi:DNA-binding GntR family transcriptional regulator
MDLQFSLTAKVANHIRRMIELQKLRPGDVVPLEQIQEALSVSRTPTREAIRQLQLEHLVGIEPGRGAYVSPITAAEISDLYQFRIEIEKQAARMAAGRISKYDLTILQGNVEEYAEQTNNPERLSLLDRQFHYTIAAACGNRYVEKTLNSLRIRMGLLRQPAYHNAKRVDYTLSEHADILNALKEEDADRAEEAMHLHVENSWKERMFQEHID